MADTKETVVYITLVCIGVVLTTVFVMMLNYNVRIFNLILILYLLGFSIYIFVILMISKDRNKGDLRYDVANYMSLFNIFFSTSMFILGIVYAMRSPVTYR